MVHFSVERLEVIPCGLRTMVLALSQLNRSVASLPEPGSDSEGISVGGRVSKGVLPIIIIFLNPCLTRYMRKLG